MFLLKASVCSGTLSWWLVVDFEPLLTLLIHSCDAVELLGHVSGGDSAGRCPQDGHLRR
jgi:hypothetical protein